MRTLGIIISALGFFGQAWAGPFEDGKAAVKRGDFTTAMKFFRPLADHGDAAGQNGVGYLLEHSYSDYAAAVKWYRRAADQGYAEGQMSLGALYRDGHGVPQDYAEAVKWFRRAADQGNATAQNNLGVRYQYGQGVPKDYVQSHMWYDLAALRFSALDEELHDKAIKNRDRVALKMTPAQIAEAQRLAREWKAK